MTGVCWQEDVTYQVATLDMEAMPLQRQINQSIGHLRTIQYFIHNHGSSLAASVSTLLSSDPPHSTLACCGQAQYCPNTQYLSIVYCSSLYFWVYSTVVSPYSIL